MRLGVLDTGHPRWAIDLAPRVELLGYSRYWLGEHHGHAGQSGSPEVLTAVIAAITSRIRIGPAGVLLGYYSPYKVAQSARLLEGVFHSRIDLGVARGAGGDEAVAADLLDGRPSSTEAYEAKVQDLALLLSGEEARGGRDTRVTFGSTRPFSEFWVLGATHRSALLAGGVGAAFGFSEYFAHMVDPGADGRAIVRTYRDSFRASPALAAPRWNVAVSGVGASRSSKSISTLSMAGPPPFFGTARGWRARLRDLADRYETDEIIVLDVCQRLADRRRSLSVIADAAELVVSA